MRPGQIFSLPENHIFKLGHIGKVRDLEDEKKVLGKYEVVKIEGELKGRVIVTYGNKKRKKNA